MPSCFPSKPDEATLDSSTGIILPPANSKVTLDVSLKIEISTGFDGFSGPSMHPDGDSSQGPFLLIAAKSNSGRALH